MEIFDRNGDLQEDAKEILYELGNMGIATAVKPIGNIRETEIRISVPNVITVNKDIFSELDYDPEQVVIGVSTRMNETFHGSILFFLGKEFIRNTVYEMMDVRYGDDRLLTDEDSVSAIREIINYMTAGYAKVIGAYLNTPVYISPAQIGMDQAQNIVQAVMENTDSHVDKIACVNTRFTIVDENGKKTDEAGQVLIFPDERCIEKFMEIMED